MNEGKKTLDYHQKELGLMGLIDASFTILVTLCLDLLIMAMGLNVGHFYVLKQVNKHKNNVLWFAWTL